MTSQRSTISASVFLDAEAGSIYNRIFEHQMDKNSFISESDAINVMMEKDHQALFTVRDIILDMKEHECKV